MLSSLQLQGDPAPFAMPPGVFLFLLAVPIFWLLPKRWIRSGLLVTSIGLALVTWPPLWCLVMAASIAYGFVVIRICRRLAPPMADDPPDAPADAVAARSTRKAVAFAWIALVGWFVVAALWAKIPSFPGTAKTREVWFVWLNLVGPAYMLLRLIHISVDVCHGKIGRVRLIDYLTYTLFAPTMRMGPVIRYQDFIPQLETYRERISRRNVLSGLLRILIGLVRLGVMFGIGDWLVFEEAWQHPEVLSRLWVLCTAIAVPFGLYLWTSGMSDVAIGMGRMIGFVIPENFTGPWLATSAREYWKRYHITMSSILFEYIYVPLGGNRKHVFINYFVTFLFCGLWHEFRWNQPVWALSQAIGLYVNRRWHLYWKAHAEAQSPLHGTLRRYRLADSRFSRLVSWLLAITWEAFTFDIMLDPRFSMKRWVCFMLGI
jgi:D-alanyl-lipoteichoic acid acyltransferase DltB (MBOAT superfamily)